MRKYKGVFAVMVLMALFFCFGYDTARYFDTQNTGKEQKEDKVEEQQETVDTNPVAKQQVEEENEEPPAGESFP